MNMKKNLIALAVTAAAFASQSSAIAAAPSIVTSPNSDAKCFAPWTAKTKMLQYAQKKGPYRIALSNGYVANGWRIQMIQTAKAYAAQPNVAAKLKEFKVVSTGDDVAAQVAAVNSFIDAGYDAIVINANNPTAFKPVIKRAHDAGIVLVSFDGVLDSEETVVVNVDQKALGNQWADWIIKNVPNGGKLLEVRGVPGVSVDTDRHAGIQEALSASGKKWDVVEVVGMWDDAKAQKVVADALAVHKNFAGVMISGGSTGSVQAMLDAKHPMVPIGGETENGFRKLCAAHGAEGLKCLSAGSGPAQVAVAIKAAIAALEGKVIPQSVKLPLVTVEPAGLKDGDTYFAKQGNNFFVGNAFPTCGINFTAQEIMGQNQANK